MKGRRTEKLIEWFVGLYKVKRVVSTNAIKLKLPVTIKIHPVVNVSRVQLYKSQVEGQKVVPLQPVVIDKEEEYKIEKILNRRKVQVSSLIEEVYSKGRHMERMRKFRKYERVG